MIVTFKKMSGAKMIVKTKTSEKEREVPYSEFVQKSVLPSR